MDQACQSLHQPGSQPCKQKLSVLNIHIVILKGKSFLLSVIFTYTFVVPLFILCMCVFLWFKFTVLCIFAKCSAPELSLQLYKLIFNWYTTIKSYLLMGYHVMLWYVHELCNVQVELNLSSNFSFLRQGLSHCSGTHYVYQAGLKITKISISLPPQWWD